MFSFQGLSEDNKKSKLCSDVLEEIEMNRSDPVDEQDVFLHQAGMNFARKALLFRNAKEKSNYTVDKFGFKPLFSFCMSGSVNNL